MKTFEINKSITELGIDTTRKFILVDETDHEFNKGDILVLEIDDNSQCPLFKRISDGRAEFTYLSRLAYYEEEEFKRGDIVIDEDDDEVEFIVDLGEEDRLGYSYIVKNNGEYYFSKSITKKQETEELTMEQVCKELGRTIKIIK